MACSLNWGCYVSGLNETVFNSNSKYTRVPAFHASFGSLQFMESKSRDFPALSHVDKQLAFPDQRGSREWGSRAANNFSAQGQSICTSRSLRWWEKNLKPNMVEIHSTQELVESLLCADDKLVIIDFYSPGCGGCKALHPKICQLAELNPDAIFLEVNYEQLHTMCQCLNIHVLPFFRFYRGSEGRICSFSCTNATIKKFKDALARYGAQRCSLGPAKGLDESELTKLASAGELSSNFQLTSTKAERVEDLFLQSVDLSIVLNKADNTVELKEESVLL
ncbi:hypothetical protein SLEP1_g37078 [Rubroshorea leprosula]|uniref:Thioredoxin domain-containing protein n=1 Tax=Rubroshorea leprosula TaxID=152421 RepID=A0AAV5KU78_9ROSI|nr:hypothetical protein SLEP1_g37078 [Rubroshorea leprosula]